MRSFKHFLSFLKWGLERAHPVVFIPIVLGMAGVGTVVVLAGIWLGCNYPWGLLGYIPMLWIAPAYLSYKDWSKLHPLPTTVEDTF